MEVALEAFALVAGDGVATLVEQAHLQLVGAFAAREGFAVDGHGATVRDIEGHDLALLENTHIGDDLVETTIRLRFGLGFRHGCTARGSSGRGSSGRRLGCSSRGCRSRSGGACGGSAFSCRIACLGSLLLTGGLFGGGNGGRLDGRDFIVGIDEGGATAIAIGVEEDQAVAGLDAAFLGRQLLATLAQACDVDFIGVAARLASPQLVGAHTQLVDARLKLGIHVQAIRGPVTFCSGHDLTLLTLERGFHGVGVGHIETGDAIDFVASGFLDGELVHAGAAEQEVLAVGITARLEELGDVQLACRFFCTLLSGAAIGQHGLGGQSGQAEREGAGEG